jgi:hypothetical protein
MLVFGLLWLVFGSYAFGAFGLAPPEAPDTFGLIMRIIQGETQGINPLLVSLFNIMGVLPLVYGCFLIPTDHGRKFPAGLIIALMSAVGAFALLPYLALRGTEPVIVRSIPWWVKLFDSRWLALILGAGLAFLIGTGLPGDAGAFFQQWQQERFVHVMSLDFLVLTALLPAMVAYDMVRRGIKAPYYFWLSVLMPLGGAVIYLVLRPRLQPTVSSP